MSSKASQFKQSAASQVFDFKQVAITLASYVRHGNELCSSTQVLESIRDRKIGYKRIGWEFECLVTFLKGRLFGLLLLALNPLALAVCFCTRGLTEHLSVIGWDERAFTGGASAAASLAVYHAEFTQSGYCGGGQSESDEGVSHGR